MITAGIDCGAKNTKTIIMNNGKIIGKAKVLTGFDQSKAVDESLSAALKGADISYSDVQRISSTGSGRNVVSQAHNLINDIKAMGKAASYFFPKARTVVDVGAEESRVAGIDEKGNAVDFAVNEKCAAGAGVFLEAMARALEVPLEEMGQLALKSTKDIPMNAQCVIFAESEVIGLIHTKTKKIDISKAIHDAMAGRIVSMVRRIGVNEHVAILGGVAFNPGFIKAMKTKLEVENIYIPEIPEYGGAVGAALLAALE